MTEKQRQEEEQDLCTYGLFGELECDLANNNGDSGNKWRLWSDK